MFRVFEYFDAHRMATRGSHERSRGWQRFLIATLVPPLALFGHQESSAAHQLAVATAIVSAAWMSSPRSMSTGWPATHTRDGFQLARNKSVVTTWRWSARR